MCCTQLHSACDFAAFAGPEASCTQEVRLMTAVAISEVFRLSAPDLPYDDSDLSVCGR